MTDTNQGQETQASLIVYCRSWCHDCMRAKQWLAEQGIPYTEMDVDENPEARERAAGFNEGRLHTPTFEVDGDYCVDFRPSRIKELLNMP